MQTRLQQGGPHMQRANQMQHGSKDGMTRNHSMWSLNTGSRSSGVNRSQHGMRSSFKTNNNSSFKTMNMNNSFHGGRLVRAEADPRNWFLSSARKEYNLTGKTRREREQFQSTPSLPQMNVAERELLFSKYFLFI